jgi:hypothetical protein
LIMNFGMIGKRLFRIMFKICKYFQLWENLEEEEQKFQIESSLNSI